MRRLITLIVPLVMLTSCYVFQTELTVNKELKAYAFIEGQTRPGYLTEVTIMDGSYKGQFVSVSQEQLQFHTEIDGIKFYLPVNIPRSSFEGYGGHFNVSLEKSGQPWSYKGQIIRSHYDSDPIKKIEECGYVVYEEVCRKIPNSDGSYREVCRDEGHIKEGTQEVEYRERNINEHFKAMMKSEEGEDLGQFEGDRDTVKKMYTYKGVCS